MPVLIPSYRGGGAGKVHCLPLEIHFPEAPDGYVTYTVYHGLGIYALILPPEDMRKQVVIVI